MPEGTCAKCGRDAYRPDEWMLRRQARRCYGCHLVTGRCKCDPLSSDVARDLQRRLEHQKLEATVLEIIAEQNAAAWSERVAAVEPEARERLGWPATGWPSDERAAG